MIVLGTVINEEYRVDEYVDSGAMCAVYRVFDLNRNVPLEMSVLSVGYQLGDRIYHLLPPRPPLSLDVIYLCSEDELLRFSAAGRFGYFRHLLRASDLPVGELLAAHLSQAQKVHTERGEPDWFHHATQELITLLRDDYSTLMSVLGALSDLQTEGV